MADKITHKYFELSTCVRGEHFKYTFSGGEKLQNVALLTTEQYETYKQKYNKINRELSSSPIVLTSIFEEEKLYLVRDMDGKEYPQDSNGKVERYSPLIATGDINKRPKLFYNRVKNAVNTEADESMIQYWKNHKSKYATVDLSKKTCKCPSCGKTINVADFDGAHVVIVGKGGKQYITPTCKTCNRSKVDRIFEVNTFDLVEAPE